MPVKHELIRGYAEALFSVAEAEGVLAEVEDELFQFMKVVESDVALRESLTDIAIPAERKRALLQDLLGTRANPQTVNLLGFIVEQNRARELGQIVESLLQLAAERRQRALAEVRTAVPLSDSQRKALEKALSKATGRTVELKVLVDPDVIGGIVARVEGQVFDGTVRTRLQEAKEQLGSL